MKASELMIGDWVKLMNPKGECIDYVKIDANLFGIFLRDGEEGFVRFEPIPLTPEILQKNGCTMIDKGDYGEWHIKENPNIPLWQHTEFIIFGGIEIHFVHELQHALKLCELDDLADGFKI